MKKTISRGIALILSLLICFSCSGTILAGNTTNATDEEIRYTEYGSQVRVTRPREMTTEEAKRIEKYTSSNVSMDNPQNTLYSCQKVLNIQTEKDTSKVTYQTADGCTAMLNLSGMSVVSAFVYDPVSDRGYYISENESCVYPHLKRGNTYTMSETLEKTLNELIVANDWNAISQMEGISVTVDENGNRCIEETIPELVNCVVATATPCEELQIESGIQILAARKGTQDPLTSLKNDFPEKNKENIYSTSLNCGYLGMSVPVLVKESRNTYVRKTASWYEFLPMDTFEAIAEFLSKPNSLVKKIMDLLGVAYAMVNDVYQILENVSLLRDAEYTFIAGRHAYVWDTTNYKQFVFVYEAVSEGRFTGGYDKDGMFTWVISRQPAALNTPATEYASKAMYNYTVAVSDDGYCTEYMPE